MISPVQLNKLLNVKKNDPYRPTLTSPSAYTNSHTYTERERVLEQRNIETTVKSDAKGAERGERARRVRSRGRGDGCSSENVLLF